MSIGKFLRTKKISKNKLELIKHFKSTLEGTQSVEDISKLIVETSSKLGYFDCIMYVFSDDRKTLIQKAAFGPKISGTGSILQPIVIELGKGVVGSVALSGKGEIIGNTLNDSRYFIDDDIRLSEITIPVMHNDIVIGVIDSEHPKQNFYTEIDFQFWQEIASIMAPKLNEKIEEEKQV